MRCIILISVVCLQLGWSYGEPRGVGAYAYQDTSGKSANGWRATLFRKRRALDALLPSTHLRPTRSPFPFPPLPPLKPLIPFQPLPPLPSLRPFTPFTPLPPLRPLPPLIPFEPLPPLPPLRPLPPFEPLPPLPPLIPFQPFPPLPPLRPFRPLIPFTRFPQLGEVPFAQFPSQEAQLPFKPFPTLEPLERLPSLEIRRYNNDFGGFGGFPGFGMPMPNMNSAFASGVAGPGLSHQIAAINPMNPLQPNVNVVNRFSEPTGPDGNYYSVSTSSFSTDSNVNGKRQSHRKAETVVNNNGMVTEYKVEN